MPSLDPLPWLNQLHWRDMEDNPARATAGGRKARPILFSRWGGLGSHRYPVGFSGDTFNDWRSLAFQPYFTATAGNVGYPYWSHDIGGHQPGPVEAELYTRWIQWGALSPILRTHATANPKAERRIWAYPEPFYGAMKDAYLLRYSLIPYLYAAARENHDTGIPLCRPMYLEWPEEADAYNHPNQYYLGPDLVANPVVDPCDPLSSASLSATWLPPGKWTNWFTGEEQQGPKVVSRLVPLEQTVLWARAGAIIPQRPSTVPPGAAPPWSNFTWATTGALVLNAFPGDGDATLYDDDGFSTDYAAGRAARVAVRQRTQGTTATLSIRAVAGGAKAGNSRNYIVNVPFRSALRLPQRDAGIGRRSQSQARVGQIADGPITVSLPSREQLDISYTHHPSWAAGEPAHPLTRFRPDALSLILNPSIPVAEKIALQELGIRARLDVETLADGNSLRATADVSVHSPVEGMTADLTLHMPKRDGGPAATDISVGGQSIREGAPARLTRVLALPPPGTAPAEARITGEVVVHHGDLGLTVPLSANLLAPGLPWWVAGPFDNPENIKLDRVFEPESQIITANRPFDPATTYGLATKDGGPVGWRRVVRKPEPGDDLSSPFVVDLHALFNAMHENAACYAVSFLRADADTTASVALGSDDGVAAWVNGREVWRNAVGRPIAPGQDRFEVWLKKGRNQLLLKISQGSFGWAFSADVIDAHGQPIPGRLN